MIARFAVFLAEHERTAARPAPRGLHHVLRDGSALGSVGYDANGNVTTLLMHEQRNEAEGRVKHPDAARLAEILTRGSASHIAGCRRRQSEPERSSVAVTLVR
jgi:hypothetical protein